MRLFAIALSLFVLPLSAQAESPVDPVPHLSDEALHTHPTVLEMLLRSNDLRANRGLAPHQISPELTQAAQDQAEYMAAHHVFSHYVNGGPGGRAARYGFNGNARENIAMGYSTLEITFNGWRNSSGHYASIVSNTSHAGFGYALSANGTPYYVGVYGTPRPPVAESDTESGAPAAELAQATTQGNQGYSYGRRNRGSRRRR